MGNPRVGGRRITLHHFTPAAEFAATRVVRIPVRSQTGDAITPQHSAAFSYRRGSVCEMVENHRQEDHLYGFVGQWERFSGSTDERHPATRFPLRFRKHFLRWFYSDDVRVQSTREPSRIATRSAAKVQYNSDRCVSERVGDDLQPPAELLRTITPTTIVTGGHIRFVVIHSADCQITTISGALQGNGPLLADDPSVAGTNYGEPHRMEQRLTSVSVRMQDRRSLLVLL